MNCSSVCSEFSGVAVHGDGRLVYIDWGASQASGAPVGTLTLLKSDDLATVGQSSEEVEWRGARCETSAHVVLERTWHLAAIDTGSGGSLGAREAFSGPGLGTATPFALCGLACGDTSHVWASGLFGMGAMALGP